MSPHGSQNDTKRDRENDDQDTTSKRPCVSQPTSDTEDEAECDAWCEKQANKTERTLETLREIRGLYKKMRGENERLKKQNDNLEEQNYNLKEQNDNLKEQLLEASIQNTNMSSQFNRMCTSMDQLTQQVTNQRACNWKLSLE